MEISKMRSRITIQKNTVEVDAIGNRKVVWTDFYSCYGKITAAAAPCHCTHQRTNFAPCLLAHYSFTNIFKNIQKNCLF